MIGSTPGGGNSISGYIDREVPNEENFLTMLWKNIWKKDILVLENQGQRYGRGNRFSLRERCQTSTP